MNKWGVYIEANNNNNKKNRKYKCRVVNIKKQQQHVKVQTLITPYHISTICMPHFDGYIS